MFRIITDYHQAFSEKYILFYRSFFIIFAREMCKPPTIIFSIIHYECFYIKFLIEFKSLSVFGN